MIFDFSYISERIQESLQELNKEDKYLLNYSLSERSIAHKFAEKLNLNNRFPGYDIDCEYDKSCIDPSLIKKIKFHKEEAFYFYQSLKEENKRLKKYLNSNTNEPWQKLVVPDVIVHKRGKPDPDNCLTFNDNLLVFEIKKQSSTNNNNKKFDYFKLMKYTSSEFPISLKYVFGVYIEINDNYQDEEEMRNHKIIYFKNGNFFH